MMDNTLDCYAQSYSKKFKFSLDNEIILNWYPKRIMGLTHSENYVLELGLGYGYSCALFSEFYKTYTIIDGSRKIIEKFRNEYPNIQVEIVNAYFEEFTSTRKFDVIIMGFVLEHVEDPEYLLNYFRQFLALDGRLFITVPNAESLHRRFGHAAGLLPDLFTLDQGDLELGHKRLYTSQTLTKLLQRCRYKIVLREGVFLKPISTRQLQSLELSEEIFEGMCRVGIQYPELSAALLFEARSVQ